MGAPLGVRTQDVFHFRVTRVPLPGDEAQRAVNRDAAEKEKKKKMNTKK